MKVEHNRLNGPIRVVLFGGGPVLDQGVKVFISRLAEDPQIDFLGAYCQSNGQSLWAIFTDLWQRRHLLAFPLLINQFVGYFLQSLSNSDGVRELQRKISRLADRIHFVPDIHAEYVLACVRALQPDLGLIYGSPILKPTLFEIPTFGTLGIHHGKLPEYRGKKTTFWAIYNGETTASVTIQKINAGLDTGEIVKHASVPTRGHSLSAVWRELEALGVEIYIQAILEIKGGTACYTPQAGRRGRVYRDPKINDILVFLWKQIFK
jgi:folate-dependent phosphoribosylglycinamide formyltransferase PurN